MNRMFTPTAYWSFALERGDWDATWYCIDCYMRYYICSYRAVCHRLGSIARAAKKALYAHGENQGRYPFVVADTRCRSPKRMLMSQPSVAAAQ